MSSKEHDDQETTGEPEPAPQAQAQPAEPQEQQQAADLLARLQRVSADFLNYKKRVQREIDDSRQFAAAELVKGLLPVLDDMERALAAWRANPAGGQALADGMQLVQTKLLDTLTRAGVSQVVDPVGRKFDPHVHSAICQQPSDKHPEMTVLEEVRRGYQMHGRTLRPADVVVSRRPEPAAPEES